MVVGLIPELLAGLQLLCKRSDRADIELKYKQLGKHSIGSRSGKKNKLYAIATSRIITSLG